MKVYNVTHPYIWVHEEQIVLTLSVEQAKILESLTANFIWELEHPDWEKGYFSEEDNRRFSEPIYMYLEDEIPNCTDEVQILLTVDQAEILNKLVKYNIEGITNFNNQICLPGHNELLAEPLSLLLSSFLNYIEDINGNIVWHINAQN